MKRKFPLNLAPVKVPSKPESSAEPTPSQQESSSYIQRGKYNDNLGEGVCVRSPWISRRELSPDTEKELRAACALILQNFKPSDHGMADIDPKLDFRAMDRQRERKTSSAQQVKTRRPTGAPSDVTVAHEAPKRTRSAKAVQVHVDPPPQANTGRRRVEHVASLSKEHDNKRSVKSPPSEPLARTVTVRSELESDDAKSVRTPLTGSTEIRQNSGSTAPTSAPVTSGENSNRTSHQKETLATATASQTVHRRAQESGRVSNGPASQPRESIDQTPQARPPSRAKNITSNIRGYLSRKQSQESINTVESPASPRKELCRTESNRWQSWGLQRKSSFRRSRSSSTSRGQAADEAQSQNQEVNLNRDLPPLPSLDTWDQAIWKDQAEASQLEDGKLKSSGAHIATVMRSHDAIPQEHLKAPRVSHRRSGSDTLALRYETSQHCYSASRAVQSSTQSKTSTTNSTLAQQQVGINFNASLDFDEMMSAMGSPKVAGQSPQARPKYSLDVARLEPPNFSRKISSDMTSPRFQGRDHPGYQNMVEIGPKATPQKQETKSRLRKALSGWMLKKEKKEHWMDQFEKNGIKGGVMIQDEPALAPVIRY